MSDLPNLPPDYQAVPILLGEDTWAVSAATFSGSRAEVERRAWAHHRSHADYREARTHVRALLEWLRRAGADPTGHPAAVWLEEHEAVAAADGGTRGGPAK